jgi:speckle-type POZ protein
MGYELIKRSDLEESVYLKDDIFSVRCDVTVAKEIFTKALPISDVFK